MNYIQRRSAIAAVKARYAAQLHEELDAIDRAYFAAQEAREAAKAAKAARPKPMTEQDYYRQLRDYVPPKVTE